MKRIFTILLSALVSIALFAQAPNMMDFQSLVRDASGNFVSNKTIGVQISILKTSATGTVVYCETHSVNTNANGLLTLTIGTGTVQTGTFASIDWSAGPYFLKTEMDVNGGTSYTLTQTTQMMTVPYALYANKAGNVPDVSALEARIAALETKNANGGTNIGTVVKTSDGAIPAAFSVSATQKVYFSKGNLQYQASTKIWRFAANQYDYIGSNNTKISSTYTGWIDLFGWGTGSNPTQTSTSESNYSTFTDWGKNAISNGGNIASAWRTLSQIEWDYLIKTRSNATNLRFHAIVNGVYGLVLLPDNFLQAAKYSYVISAYKPNLGYTDPFDTNLLNSATWSVFESFGAVFLPCAGIRNGTQYKATLLSGKYEGFYWAYSPVAYLTFDFYSNAANKLYGCSTSDVDSYTTVRKYHGFNVRLVKNVQ